MVEARPQRAPRMGALSDADLVARAQAGDREAFDPLYRRYAGAVVRYAAARTPGRGPHFAEDVAADTWAVALQKIDQFRGLAHDGSFRAWLCGIAKYQVFKTAVAAAGRELATVAGALERWADDGTAPTAAGSGGDQARGRELRLRVYHAVAELGPLQREVARLRLAGMGPAEIAEKTGQTPKQVYENWCTARTNLQGSFTRPVPADALTRLRALDELAASPLADAEVERDRAELRARVDQAVAELPGRMQREAARLRLDGLSLSEIAGKTGWTHQQAKHNGRTAKVALNRALADTAPADTPEAEQRTRVADDTPEAPRTAVCDADASPVDTRRLDDDADASTPAEQPDTRPGAGFDVWQDSGPDTGRSPSGSDGLRALAGSCQGPSYRASDAADDTNWRHERQLVGAGAGAGDVRDRARVDADDDADGW